MGDGTGSGHSKEGKASFDHIYDLEDPREYFKVLGELDYRAPHNGQLLFSVLVEAKKRATGAGSEEVTLVDVACSYGVNGALLKYDVTLDDLYERYRSEGLSDLSGEELAAADVEFFGGRKKEAPPRVVGMDLAENAISYALRVGLLDAGFAENLEEDEPTDALKTAVSGMDLLIVTGGIGYIGVPTFDRLLACTAEGRRPWVATFPLRMVDYEPISDLLSAKYGLVTEKLPEHTFPQRRFKDAEEQEYVLEELDNMGIDVNGKETTGYHHSDFYLSRPSEHASETPIKALFSDQQPAISRQQ